MEKILIWISRVSARTLLVLFIFSSLVCIFALRHNNQEMIKLRDAVYIADKNNGDVNTALNNLRRYIYGHMNTDLSSGGNNIKPPIQLKYTYQRLYEAQLSLQESSNQKIFNDAQAACKANTTGYDPQRLYCIQNYAVNHGVKGADINIPAGLYEFDFASPSWSDDLAGFSLLASIFLLLAFLVKFVIEGLGYKNKAP
jgi:hypothetical protein